MPYTEQKERPKVDNAVSISEICSWSAGDLTYALTRLIVGWFKGHGKSFLNGAIVIGCIACTALEFYRRVLAPYEDKKIADNGDVY
jgi:hypothetical protein